MFSLTHILYMIISALITAGLLTFFYFKIKDDAHKTIVLKFFAIITVVLHFSSLWVDFFKEGEAVIREEMLFPIHPCNVCMWLILICAFIKNRSTKFYRILSEFCFLGGTVCGIIGILLNTNFDNNPTLLDYDVLKGLLSHSTMIVATLYLLVSGFVKIRIHATFSAVCGLLLFVVDGFIINTLYSIFNIEACNSMYLIEAPFPDMPWLNAWVMGLMGVTLAFLICAVYEQIFLKKEERWYSLLIKKTKNAR